METLFTMVQAPLGTEIVLKASEIQNISVLPFFAAMKINVKPNIKVIRDFCLLNINLYSVLFRYF